MSKITRLGNKRILATKENIEDILSYIREVQNRENKTSTPVYTKSNPDIGIPDELIISTFIKNPTTGEEDYVYMSLQKDESSSYYNVLIDEDFHDSCIAFIDGFTAWKSYKYVEQNSAAKEQGPRQVKSRL